MKEGKQKNGLLFNMMLLTVFFNIWFPKAGIKIGEIPLTVGNVVFAVTFFLWIYEKIKCKKFRSYRICSIILIGIAYFILKYTVVFGTQGTIIGSIGFIIPLIIYPLVFFIISDVIDDKQKMESIIKCIIYGFFFLSIYSILQYIIGIEKCCIPGVTVNYSDYSNWGRLWYMHKSNGIVVESTKIVSTYQNGNLYGINTLLIYPIVYNYYKNRNRKLLATSLILFVVCVFLSLSRACWLGIVLFIFMEIIMENQKTINSIFRKIFTIIMCFVVIFLVFKYVPSIAERFTNTDKDDWISMSGRTEGMQAVVKTVNESNSVWALLIGPYGVSEYEGLAYEMFPLSVFVQTGIIGLVILYGTFIRVVAVMNKYNFIQKSIRRAIIIWLIVGIIECGYWLPPTAINLFVMIGIGYASKYIDNEGADEFE